MKRAVDTMKLLVVKRFAHRRYHSCPNLLAVGIGTKFKRRSPGSVRAVRVEGLICLQFFVARKRERLKSRERLPRFVYARYLSGRVDYRRKIPTDVIPVGGILGACRAGSRLDAEGDHGLITLLFRNKVAPRGRFYLISCAHVAGDLHRSPPAYPELTCVGSRVRPFARTVANATARAGEIRYDIALAKIEDRALPLPELRIRGSNAVLESFFPPRFIQPGLGVSVALRSRSIHGTVDSLDAAADIRYGGETLVVHHLFGVNVSAGKGDSGGLVYRETQAVGIVVAASPRGWLWFQPLEPAISFLNSIAPVNISVFNSKPNET